MSDGINLCSPCCPGEMCLKKEYDEYKIKKVNYLKDSEEFRYTRWRWVLSTWNRRSWR